MRCVDRGVHSFGEELRAVQLDTIRVSETVVPRSLALETHHHDPAQICVLLEGGFRDRSAAGDQWLGPGIVRWRRPRWPHSNVFDAGDDTLVLLISIEDDRWVFSREGLPVVAPLAWRTIVADIQRELRNRSDESMLALEALSVLLASRVTRGTFLERDEAEPRWVADAVAHIQSSFMNPITVTSIASHVGVHRATLAAAFRRYRGTSVGELIRELRVQRVMELLATTRMPLDELAHQSGFCDQSHLGRFLKRSTGMTPRQYRTRN
jgi:AraC family transcriptional regulator